MRDTAQGEGDLQGIFGFELNAVRPRKRGTASGWRFSVSADAEVEPEPVKRGADPLSDAWWRGCKYDD